MSISKRIIDITTDVRDQAGAYVAKAADTARVNVDRAARRVEAANTPVETLAHAGHRLNTLAHNYAERMVEQQANMVKGVLHDGAERLRMLAKAGDARSALTQQVAYFDVTRARIVRNAKHTYGIVADAGRGASELAAQTYTRLLAGPQRKPRAAVKASRKTVRRAKKPAKSRARKAA